MPYWHWAGIRPNTSSFDLAESWVFGKLLLPLILCHLSLERLSFSRSYGYSLPSSFMIVLSSAFVFSTYLPMSDCGTVRLISALFPAQSIKRICSLTFLQTGSPDWGQTEEWNNIHYPSPAVLTFGLGTDFLDSLRFPATLFLTKCLSLLMSAFSILI